MRTDQAVSPDIGQSASKLCAWFRIARLQFYPMAFVAYSLGAAVASGVAGLFSLPVYLLGYAVCFLIEFCTILTNEYCDYETDRMNRNFSMFSGGARVLVEGRLGFKEVGIGIVVVLFLVFTGGYLLVAINRDVPPAMIVGFLLAGLLMGLGYTVPPVKLAYRGLGETTVGITHTFYLILSGYVFQTGDLYRPLPWLLSLPLFLAVFAAIVLAGLPDRLADSAAGKRTLAVILGPRTAIFIAGSSAAAATGVAIPLYGLTIGYRTALLAAACTVPHALALAVLLVRLLRSGRFDGRIDNVMGAALGYIIWFGLIPLLALI